MLLIQFPPVQNHPKITLCKVLIFFLQLNASERRDIDIHICHFINYNHLLSNFTDDVLAKKKKKALDSLLTLFRCLFGTVCLSPLKIPSCARFQSDLSPVFNTPAAAYKIRKHQSSYRYHWNLQRKITKPSFLSFLLQNNSCSTGVIT